MQRHGPDDGVAVPGGPVGGAGVPGGRRGQAHSRRLARGSQILEDVVGHTGTGGYLGPDQRVGAGGQCAYLVNAGLTDIGHGLDAVAD